MVDRQQGGKRATIGILMLDNSFERHIGDMGRPETWDFPVLYRRVPGATTSAITTLDDDRFLAPFVAAAEALIADGCDGIATSCGFLALYQPELARRLTRPVAASALLQIPLVERIIQPDRAVGVLTFDAQSLGASHLAAVGVGHAVPIVGLARDGRFRRALLGDASVDGYEVREAEAVEAARRLIGGPVPIGAIVLECTNLVPHATAIHVATGLPIYDVVTLVAWFEAGLRPRAWPSG